MAIQRKRSFYEKYIKRLLDIVCSLLAINCFSWLFMIIAIMVRIKMGSPVIFKQPRPGMIDPKTGKEKIFNMYKFRTMTNERDAEGNLLPDEDRLPAFGKWLRSTSLDELPELFNILAGSMSYVGPRPLLVKYLPYYTDEERVRHSIRPGLTGYAQVHGRNEISWDKKFELDVWYVENLTFRTDMKVIIDTIKAVLSHEGVSLNALEDFDEYRKRANSNQ